MRAGRLALAVASPAAAIAIAAAVVSIVSGSHTTLGELRPRPGLVIGGTTPAPGQVSPPGSTGASTGPAGSRSPGGGPTGRHGGGPTSRPTPRPTGSSPPPPGHPRRHLVPAFGAYLGGYVQPASDSQQGQINAVLSLEHQLGRPLGLVHMYHPWGSSFPDKADTYFAEHGKVLLLTWGGAPDATKIIDGHYDALIRARALALKRLNRPVLLEWRHEMDRPDLLRALHSPADYIAAWKHIRAVFAAAGADNVSWVWCPTAWGFKSGRAQPFYPGDSQVDWICADGYSSTPSHPLAKILGPFLSWASHHPRPVLIGEFGERTDPAGWASWLAGVGELAKRDTQIKGLAYFDADGTSARGLRYRFSLKHSASAMAEFSALLSERFFSPAVPGMRG
jgi:hypothetical protein